MKPSIHRVLRAIATADLSAQPGKHHPQNQRQSDLDDHELGEAQPALRLVVVSQLATKHLRDEDLAAEVLVVSLDLLGSPLQLRIV